MAHQGYDLQLTRYDERGWRATFYTTGDGTRSDKRDGHRMGAQALARDTAGGVGGVEEGGLLGLGGCPPRHGFSERTLAPEERGLGLPDQDVGSVADLLALFHAVLRRLPAGLRPESYFRGQHRAAVQVGADILSETLPTSSALVSAASPKRISGKFCKTKAEATGQALRDDMIGTVDEQKGALVHGQRSGSRTVHMRQTAPGGVDDVAERDQLEALRTLHLHGTPRSTVSSGGPGRVTS